MTMQCCWLGAGALATFPMDVRLLHLKITGLLTGMMLDKQADGIDCVVTGGDALAVISSVVNWMVHGGILFGFWAEGAICCVACSC